MPKLKNYFLLVRVKVRFAPVVIRPAKFTYVEIEPYAASELQQLIEEFGLWIWQKTHPTSVKARVEIPPDELLRAIRNIVKLPEIIVHGKIEEREIQLLTQQFEQIRTGKDFAQLEQEIVLVAQQKIRELSSLNLASNSFANDYVDMLPEHHCTLRATNNRYGQYELRDIDIYFNGRYLAENLIRQSTEKYKSELLNLISFIETEISVDSTLSAIVQRLRSQIDGNYEDLAIDLGVEIETILSDRLLAPKDYDESTFWQQTIDRWGQGSGYKVDVLSLYTQQVSEIDELFADLIQTAWIERIIQPILVFLGDRSAPVD